MNIRQVRKKIRSVSNVQKITKAMQLVSAVKMKKYQQTALESRAYQAALTRIIKKITATKESTVSKLFSSTEKPNDKKLSIVVTSNKGLAGGFNVNLLRHVLKNTDIRSTDFISVGKKGTQLLTRFGGNIIADFSSGYEIDVSSSVFSIALNSFVEGRYSSVSIFYNAFVSAIRFEPTEDVLLPFYGIQEEEQKAEGKSSEHYTVEPSPDEILEALLKSYIEEKIRFALLQNEAGEHSARMMAMKNATDNANELIFSLTLLRNKVRQEAITNELLDMITAQAAV